MNLDRKLVAYAAAAAAAGLAAAESADGAIVSRPGFTFGSGTTNNINFDNAGAEEYQVGHRTGPNRVTLLKDTNALNTNAYAVTAANVQPAALPAGTIIGPSSTYSTTVRRRPGEPGHRRRELHGRQRDRQPAVRRRQIPTGQRRADVLRLDRRGHHQRHRPDLPAGSAASPTTTPAARSPPGPSPSRRVCAAVRWGPRSCSGGGSAYPLPRNLSPLPVIRGEVG